MTRLPSPEDPRVCVIVTCFDQPELAPEAICSALRQDLRCNIVLVNDGCQYRETHEFCTRIRTAYSDQVLYIRQNNRGPGAARNAAIEVALKAWPILDAVFFLDGDNRLSPSTIRRMYRVLLEERADWVFSDMEVIGSESLIGMAGDYCALEHILRNYVDTGSLVARHVLDAGLRFDPEFRRGFEDWDFWLSAARMGFRGVYMPMSGFRYRRRPESMLRNALRDQDEIVRAMRRKHSEWINPRNCVKLEHLESPRYALIISGSDRVCLLTDPSARDRHMPLEEFLGRTAQRITQGRLCRMPPYLVTASEETIKCLEQHRLLHGLFWQLEAAAARCRSSVALNPAGEKGYEIRKISRNKPPGVMALGHLVPPPGRAEPWPIKRIGGIDLSMLRDRTATAELTAVMERARAVVMRKRPDKEALLLSWANRRTESVSLGIKQLWGTGPLFPAVNSGPCVGFFLKADTDEPLERYLATLISEVRAVGWSAHLFWIRHRNAPLCKFRRHFDRVTLLSDEALRNARNELVVKDLLGLLSGLDVVVIHECPEWLHLAGELKRFGVRTVFSACEETWLDVVLPYEYALAGYLTGSESARRRYHARGVPSAKVWAELGGKLNASG